MNEVYAEIAEILARHPLIICNLKAMCAKYGFEENQDISQIFANAIYHQTKSHEALLQLLQIIITEAMNGFPKPTKKECKDVFTPASLPMSDNVRESPESIEIIESVKTFDKVAEIEGVGGMSRAVISVNQSTSPQRDDAKDCATVTKQKHKRTNQGELPEGSKELLRILLIPSKKNGKPKNKTDLGSRAWPKRTKAQSSVMVGYFLPKAASVFSNFLGNPSSIPEKDRDFFSEIIAARPQLNREVFMEEIKPWLPKKTEQTLTTMTEASEKESKTGAVDIKNGANLSPEVVSVAGGVDHGQVGEDEKIAKAFRVLKAVLGSPNRVVFKRPDLRKILSTTYPDISDEELDRLVDDALQVAYDKWIDATENNKSCPFMIFLWNIKSRYDGNWNILAKRLINLSRSAPSSERLDVNILCDGVVVRSTW